MGNTVELHRSLEADVAGTFEDALVRVRAAFKEQGFNAVSELDVRKRVEEVTGETIEPYTVVGFCNAHLALRAIRAEHEIGTMLPCSVLVHECGGTVHVRAQDPGLLADATGNHKLHPVAEETRDRIAHAIDALRTGVAGRP